MTLLTGARRCLYSGQGDRLEIADSHAGRIIFSGLVSESRVLVRNNRYALAGGHNK